MLRRLALIAGIAAGVAAGWMLTQDRIRHHRADLFSRRPLRRMAALAGLRAEPGVETVRLLRDYLEWERHPVLRRRARGIVRRMEAALG
ncbi:MAG TPA: hypothetical protein VLD58_05400 [Gemmatimonadales bacterium]|nr:hypothetical protein [Gemmatimonadales bacterium]